MGANNAVTLFIQCLVDGIYPEVGEAMVYIFRKLGLRPHNVMVVA